MKTTYNGLFFLFRSQSQPNRKPVMTPFSKDARLTPPLRAMTRWWKKETDTRRLSRKRSRTFDKIFMTCLTLKLKTKVKQSLKKPNVFIRKKLSVIDQLSMSEIV